MYNVIKIFIYSVIVVSVMSCSGANLLLKGEQIGILWNGQYTEAISGNAYMNVGNKKVEIRSIDIIPNLIYQVDQVLDQETELKVWLYFNNYYIPLKMTRENLTQSTTIIYINSPTLSKSEFPTVFETNIIMIRH